MKWDPCVGFPAVERVSSTLQRGCDGVHSSSPAQHSFVWGKDGADLYIGPICDALTGWWEWGESYPEHRSQCNFNPKLTQSDPKQLCNLAGEVSAVIIPGTECLLNWVCAWAVFASSDGLDKIQNSIWILLYLVLLYLVLGFFFSLFFFKLLEPLKKRL